jgi:hypothetical protein
MASNLVPSSRATRGTLVFARSANTRRAGKNQGPSLRLG